MPAKELAQARILVVDEDAEILGFVKWALINAKVSAVRSVASAAEALDAIRDFGADAALVEMQSQTLDGVEFLRRVRGRGGEHAELPVILMTKTADAAQIQAACALGLNNIIAKPFTADALLKRIRTTLRYPDRHIQFSAPPPEPKPAVQPAPDAPETPAPRAARPRPAAKRAEPRRAEPRKAVKVDPPKRAEPRRAVKAPPPAQAAPRPTRDDGDDIPLVEAAAAPPEREDVPLVDAPVEAPAPAEGVPLVEPEAETPEDEIDEIAAEIAEIVSGHKAWLASGGKSGQRAEFSGAELAGREFAGQNLASASFREANLQDADFDSANLNSADLRGANLSAARFSNADLGQARLRRAVLKAANLSGASLKDADFAGADCSNADFSGADITRVNFLGANLAGADLRGEELTQSQLDKAMADATTKLPGGLRLPISEE